MKEFDYNGKKIKVPTSWNDVTLWQVMEAERLYRAEPIQEFKFLALVAAYCGLTIEQVKTEKLRYSKQVFQMLQEFIETEKEPELPVTQFEHKGETFSVIETLLKQQTQDFISIEGKLFNNKDSEYKVLPTMIAICAKKKKQDGTFETLADYDLVEREKFFYDLPVPIAYSIRTFFFNDRKTCYSRLQRSSNKSRSKIDAVNKLYEDYNKKTNWWGSIFSLAKGDVTKLPQILETKLEIILLWSSIGTLKSDLDFEVQEIISSEAEKKSKQKRR